MYWMNLTQGLFPRQLNKLSEQIPRRLLVCQPFRVPLDGETEGVVRKFDGFHETIRGVTGDTQRWRNVFESLVVQAVDFDDRLAIDLSNACSLPRSSLHGRECPLVTGVIMVKGIRELVWNVGVKVSAQCDVERLAAAADAEKRLAIRGGGLDHFEFNGIPRRVLVIDARMGIAGGKFQGDIPAPRE